MCNLLLILITFLLTPSISLMNKFFFPSYFNKCGCYFSRVISHVSLVLFLHEPTIHRVTCFPFPKVGITILSIFCTAFGIIILIQKKKKKCRPRYYMSYSRPFSFSSPLHHYSTRIEIWATYYNHRPTVTTSWFLVHFWLLPDKNLLQIDL
jgi:hypothetical protein